ncbi:MAG: DUF5915 domain-containing protein, partial [Ignavibacterium sp.]
GKKVKAVAEIIKNFGKDEIKKLESGENISVEADGENLTITFDDVEIMSHQIEGWVVESEEGVTVAIDTELNQNLIEEGLAREFVNRVQNMRKDAGFDVTDKINISFTGSPEIVKAIENFSEYISNETLAEKLISQQINDGGFRQDWKIGDYECSIRIEKI